MGQRILVTGDLGLIGSVLRPRLELLGHEVVSLDIRFPPLSLSRGDITDQRIVERALKNCDGVVHLAGTSRVKWGERNPAKCWRQNVGGTRLLIDLCMKCRRPPWIVFTSSREVYGVPEVLPCPEHARTQPINVYGRSKLECEHLLLEARQLGVHTIIVRLSNVYGAANDHSDRVVPAFLTRAMLGQDLEVHGAESTFDFTFVHDVVDGLVRLLSLTSEGTKLPPPLHFVTGIPTTLSDLAQTVIRLVGSSSRVIHSDPRTYDVSHFWGSPSFSESVLGWKPETRLIDGLECMLDEFQRCKSHQ